MFFPTFRYAALAAALAFTTGQASPFDHRDCGFGLIPPNNDWAADGACRLQPHNTYACPNGGQVQHNLGVITLSATAKADLGIYIECGDSGPKFLWCKAGSGDDFNMGDCYSNVNTVLQISQWKSK